MQDTSKKLSFFINKNKTILQTLGITIVILATLYTFVLPKLININAHRDYIFKMAQLKNRINGKLEIGKLGLELPLTGGIVITIDKIKIFKKNGDFVGSGNDVKVKIAILPLLFQDIVVKDFRIKDLTGNITRISQNKLDIEELLLPPLPDDIYIIRYKGTKAFIRNYVIALVDTTTPEKKTFLLTGEVIKVNDFTENKRIKAYLKGNLNKTTPFDLRFMTSLPLNDKKLLENQVAIRGNIDNIDLKVFAAYLPYKNIQGNISLQLKNSLRHKRLKVNSSVKIIESIVIPGLNIELGEGDFSIKAFLNDQKLIFKEINSNINGIEVFLKGKILQWQKSSSKLNLVLSTNTFNINKLLKLIPDIPETHYFLKKLKRLKISGTNEAILNIKGTKENPLIYGDISITDYVLTLPNKSKISTMRGNFHFKGPYVDVKNWVIILPGSNLVQIHGGFNFNKLKFEHLQTSSTNFNIKVVQELLETISDLFDIDIPLLEKTNVQGTTKFNLDFYGDLLAPFIDGKLTIDARKIRVTGSPVSVNSAKGDLLFKKDALNFNDLDLQLTSDTSLLVKGKYDYIHEEFENLRLISKRIDLQYLKNIITILGPTFNINVNDLSRLSFTGSTKIDIKLRGTFNNLKGYGSLSLNNINIHDKPTSLSINDITGDILLNKAIYANNITAKLLNNLLKISAVETFNGIGEIKVTLPDFKLESIKTLANKLNTLTKEQEQYLQEASLGGSITGYISLITKENQADLLSNLNFKDNTFYHPFLNDTIHISNGGIILKNNQLNINDITAFSNGTTFKFSGYANKLDSKTPDYSLNLISTNITKELIQKIGENQIIPEEFRIPIESITKITGDAKLSAQLSNDAFDTSLNLKDLEIYSSSLDKPIHNISGNLKLCKKEIVLNNFSVNYGSSYINFNGGIINLTTSPYINSNLEGKLFPVDFKEFYTANIRDNLVFSDPIVFNGKAKGNLNNWDINFTSSISADAQIAVKGLFQKPKNTPINFIAVGTGTKKAINIDKILLEVGNNKFMAEGALVYSEKELLLINELNIKIPVLNLSEINEFLAKDLLTDDLAGEISSDLKISGTALNPDINGFINFKEVSLPMLKTKDLSFNIDLLGRDAVIKDVSVNINDILFEASAYINDFRKLPLQITNLQIYSPSLVLTKLLESISDKTQNVKMDQIPIEIKTGSIKIDDAIIDKLITSNLKGNLYLCSNGNFQINNLQLNTAGGKASGNLYLNFLSETLGAQLEIVGVKANAAATTLLDLPNEIFGDLNATIIFDSKGTEYNQIIENAEGRTSLIISNGRFSKLGTLEHLLTATNIIGSGITGINLNNIIASVIPMHTGDFKFLTGDFTVTKGILHTDNLTTRGKNLSLEIAGAFNISTEIADLDIKGSISRTVSGVLGPLGKLNIDTLTDFVPGLGFIPGVSNKKGLLDFIPGLGFIPGFGGPKGNDKLRKFAVEIKGNPYDMSSIKNFRWTN